MDGKSERQREKRAGKQRCDWRQSDEGAQKTNIHEDCDKHKKKFNNKRGKKV